MKSKPITMLLAIIALLVAVNLIVNLPSQEAQAQAQPPWLPPVDDSPRLVGISVVGTPAPFSGTFFHILRLWSDGVVEERVAHNDFNPSGPLTWHPTIIPEWVEIVP